MKRYLLILLTLVAGAFSLSADPVTHVYISEVFYDSPLQENKRHYPDEHNNGEYIELYNPTSQALDLSDWILLGSNLYEQFKFPQGTIIDADGYLLVAYRCPHTPNFTFSEFYQNNGMIDESKIVYQSAIILYNKGERILLLDIHRNVVDAFLFTDVATYGGASPVMATNGWNNNWDTIYSLHKTHVYEWDEWTTAIPYANYGIVAGIATPLAGGNAQAVDISALPSGSIIPGTPPPPQYSLEKEIPANGQVMATGAFQYTVPIEVPAGRQGVQPQISLFYNSQSGLGLAGMGWNLTGLSIISTTQSTIYHNGKTGPVPALTQSNYYNLTLDGVRLVYVTTNNNTNYFELENDNKYKIEISYNVSSGKAISAKVYLPDGSICTYGLPDDFSLRIVDMEDLNGNYMSYNYSDIYVNYYVSLVGSNQYLISGIEYGANRKKGTVHFASIKFAYEETSGNNTSMYYISGEKYRINWRMKQIESFVENQCFRRYSLFYNSGYYSQLSTIYVAAGGRSIKPLNFNYGTGVSNTIQEAEITLGAYHTTTNPEDIIVCSGKFIPYSNDDAIIVLPAKKTYVYTGSNYVSNYVATDNLYLYKNIGPSSNNSSTIAYPVGTNFRALLTANIDNTSEREIVMVNASVSHPTNANAVEKLTLKVCKPDNGSLYIINSITYDMEKIRRMFPPISSDIYHNGVVPKRFLSGDFNGDGIDEIFAIEYDGNKRSYIFDLTNNTPTPVFNEIPPVKLGGERDMVFTLDFDGDGKADIGVINSDGIRILTFKKNPLKNGQQWPYSLYEIVSSDAVKLSDFEMSGNKKRQLLIGDINGDGKTDLLLTSPCGHPNPASDYYIPDFPPVWTQLLSNGTTGFKTSMWFWPEGVNTDGGTFLQDINGDGRLDIVTSNHYHTYIRYAEGETFSSNVTDIPKTKTGGVLTTMDFSTSGNNRFLAQIVNNKIIIFNQRRNEQQEALLTKISGSNGVITELDYARLGQITNAVYTQGANQPGHPYLILSSARLWLVRNTKSGVNGQYITNNHYSYTGAVVHLQGLGFCGMYQVDTYDAIRSVSSYQIFDPLRRGVLLKEESPTQTITNN